VTWAVLLRVAVQWSYRGSTKKIVDGLSRQLSWGSGSFRFGVESGARESADRDRGAANAKQINEELGVRYVLKGSVRQSINQLRVNARLIDAHTGAHLWAGRFDRETGDLFTPQNEITSRIAVALDTELVGAEAARPTERPDALD
jgi:adenylate cyclase